ncbi:unnamed protein product [marine sediment metagenome]|uniref:Uncharacterized protein n=1 Tax=marine sediment metagenome TaxID=412755 RepID=X0U6H9_9ZZZZ
MKKLTKDIEKFTRGAVTLGVGSAASAKLATKAPSVSVTPALGTAAGMMPLVGTTMMGAGTISMVRRFEGKKKGRKFKTAVGKDFAVGYIGKKRKRRKR